MADINTTDIGSKITKALNAGSGVDIHELATNLAEAESMAQINNVTKKKEETSVSISGYGVLKAAVTSLKSSFDSLQDKDTLLTKAVSSQDPDRIWAKISSQTTALAGTTQIKVNTIARSQQNVIQNDVSDNTVDFTSLSAQLNGGSTMTFGIQPKDASNNPTGTNRVITVTNDTPQGIIDAVNAQTAITGVSARALRMAASGTSYSILLEGKTGIANRFLFTGHQGTNGVNNSETRSAVDLDVMLNGLDHVLRDNNSPSDLIEGIQLDIKVSGDTTTNIVVSESTVALEESLDTLIESYNSLITLSNYLTGEKDEEDELAGSLSKDKNTVNLTLTRARSLFSLTSATASNGFNTLRDIGITSKLGGKISLKATTYAAAIKTNFSDVRTMLTGDTNNQQASSLVSKGLALDASIILDSIVSNTGTIKVKETSVIEKVAKYEEQLLKLQDRFENIKARYLKQFAAMETVVQRSKSTGEYLTSQFKAMEGNYSN